MPPSHHDHRVDTYHACQNASQQEYINEILVTWEMSDKDADAVVDAIRVALEDASVKARETARFAYLHLFQLFPKKSERIKAALVSATVRNRLTRAEEEYVLKHRLSSSSGGKGGTPQGTPSGTPSGTSTSSMSSCGSSPGHAKEKPSKPSVGKDSNRTQSQGRPRSSAHSTNGMCTSHPRTHTLPSAAKCNVCSVCVPG